MRKVPFLLGIDRGGGTIPFFGRARLNFDEDQAVVVAHEQIDLTTPGANILSEEFHSPSLEDLLGRLLAAGAVKEMERLLAPAEPRSDGGWDEPHRNWLTGFLEKDNPNLRA